MESAQDGDAGGFVRIERLFYLVSLLVLIVHVCVSYG